MHLTITSFKVFKEVEVFEEWQMNNPNYSIISVKLIGPVLCSDLTTKPNSSKAGVFVTYIRRKEVGDENGMKECPFCGNEIKLVKEQGTKLVQHFIRCRTNCAGNNTCQSFSEKLTREMWSKRASV